MRSKYFLWANHYDKFPNLFANLNELGIDQETVDLFPEATTKVVTNSDGELYALPYGIGPTVVFAYKPLWDATFGDVKLDEISQNGWTWEEYKQLGIILNTSHSDCYMSAYNLSGDDRLYRTIVSQSGQWLLNENKEVMVGNAVSIYAMTILKNFVDHKVIFHEESGDYKTMMKSGKLAAQIQGYWLSGQIKDLAPELSGDFRILPLPSLTEGGISASITGASYLYLNDDSKNKTKAFEFMKWYTTNPENVIKGMKIGGIFPALTTAYTQDDFTASDNYFGADNYLADVVKNIETAQPIYPSQYFNQNYDLFKQAQAKILVDNNYDTIEKVMTNLADDIDAIVD